MPRPVRSAASSFAADKLKRPWPQQVIEALSHFTEELPSSCDASPEALHRVLSVAFLQLAVTALDDRRQGRAPLASFRSFAGAQAPSTLHHVLVTLREARGDWSSRTECGAVGAIELSSRTLQSWISCAEAVARDAAHGVDGPVRELGALHEVLLGVRLERMAHRARRLRKSLAWVMPAEVLAWPPALRAKRLQLAFSLSKTRVDALRARLAAATTEEALELALAEVLDPRVPPRSGGSWVMQPSVKRRRSGAHYTPWALCLELVERALRPLVEARAGTSSSSRILDLRVCDPAMGAGAFLIACADYLSSRLATAWHRENAVPPEQGPEHTLHAARAAIAGAVLYGVDKDPLATHLARSILALFAFGSASPPECLQQNLRCGDALVGSVGAAAAQRGSIGVDASPFDWHHAYPHVFQRDSPGFCAVLGNPPWVAYVGRAAQPLPPALARYYASTNPAFRRYRTLHGLFVYRAATLLRAGGRLGLILPTSVADLEGYSATREAHDRLCRVDPELPDWGDGAFSGVFQPSMALLSTRHDGELAPLAGSVWPLENHDLDGRERALLERLRRLPRFPPEQFGERGFQTTSDDQAHLVRAERAPSSRHVPLLEGADISEFRALPPRSFAIPDALAGRLRPRADWEKVAVWIRQTARYPIAARADGTAFRNSILAGFASDAWPAELLLCYLNSSLARWLHHSLHRDARQGMPQLKVGHLRALPALPRQDALAVDALLRLGVSLCESNAGLNALARKQIDALVATAFSLSSDEADAVQRWSEMHPPPTSRRRSERLSSASTGGPSGVLDMAVSG